MKTVKYTRPREPDVAAQWLNQSGKSRCRLERRQGLAAGGVVTALALGVLASNPWVEVASLIVLIVAALVLLGIANGRVMPGARDD